MNLRTAGARLGASFCLCQLLLAQVVTDTKWVANWEEKGKGREQLRKINGRWWSQDNREVFPPSKDGYFWTLDSKPGACEFFHHRPFQLARAESLHLWMTPQEVEAALGQPNRALGRDGHGFWFYYAANGTKLDVRFMGDGVLGEAKYVDIGENSRPVASIESEMGGRDIYKLLQERATKRLDEGHAKKMEERQAEQNTRTEAYRNGVRPPGALGRARVQPGVVTVAAVPVDPAQPPPAKRIVPAEGIAAIAVGATREDVLSRLGEPSSRYAITDDEGTRESFIYDLGSGAVVVIRLLRGKVTAVRGHPGRGGGGARNDHLRRRTRHPQ